MPFLAPLTAWLAGWFGRIFAYLAALWGTKATTAAALVAAFVAMSAVFLAVISTALNGLAVSIPPQAAFILSYLPDNFSACLAVVISTRIARWIYDTNMYVTRAASAV